MTKKEYHKKFDEMYGNHEPNLSLSKVELTASNAAYGWQADENGKLSLEMFPEPFKRGFLKGYEQAEKDNGWERVLEELTWKDIQRLMTIDEVYSCEMRHPPYKSKGYCEEVLRRFMEERK